MEWRLLRGFSEEEVEQVLAKGRRRRFARREVVWHEGDRAETIHLIRSGRLAIRVLTALGETATVAVLGPGEAAGLIAVHVTDPFHTTSAVSLEATETIAIRVDDLTELRRRVPPVDDALLRFLAPPVPRGPGPRPHRSARRRPLRARGRTRAEAPGRPGEAVRPG